MKQLCLFAFLLVAPIAAQGQEAPVRLKPIDLTLSVDAQGKASNIQCTANISEPTCQILVRAISGWSFAPGKAADIAVAMDGRLTLVVEAVPKPGGFGLRGVDAFLDMAYPATHASFDPEGSRPRYPEEEQKRGRTAVVIVEVWPQPGGTQPRVANVWVNGKAAGHGNAFAKAAIETAKRWKLSVDPSQLSLCIPIEYSLGRDRPAPLNDTRPCKPSFVAGYALPTLLTDVRSAVF